MVCAATGRWLAAIALTVLVLLPSTAGAQRPRAQPPVRRADTTSITAALQGESLEAALERLVQLSGINLVYDTRVIRRAMDMRIFCQVERAHPEELLGCIVREAALDYYRLSSGTYVVIARAEEAPAYGSLSGLVVDASSGLPLPRARIALAEHPADARITNEAGSFAFRNVVPGRYRMSIQAIGYEPFTTTVILPPDGRFRERFALTRYAVLTTPIVVNGLQPGTASNTLGGINYSGGSAAPLILGPGLFMPGAPSALGLTRRDGVGDLHIQGGEAGEHVWRLDGVPIFDAATLAGVFGAFSPLAIEELRLRRAGYEARDGSFTAGVIDLSHGFGEQTGADAERVRMAGQVDPFAATARVTAPFSVRGVHVQTMASARQGLWGIYQPPALANAITTWNVPDPVLLGRLTNIGRALAAQLPTTTRPFIVNAGSTDVSLRDVHAATRVEIGAFQQVSSSVYVGQHGVSTITEAGPRLSALEQSSATIVQAAEQQNTRAIDDYRWQTVAAQIRHEQLHGARLAHSVQLRTSEHSLDHDFALRVVSAPLPQDPPRRDGNRVREDAVVAGVQYAGGGRWNLDAGVELARTTARLDLQNGVLRALGSELVASRVAGYANVERRFGRSIWLDAGMRMTALPGGGVFTEPRLSLRGDGSGGATWGPWAWRVAGGTYRQFVNQFDVATSNPTALVPSVRFWLPARGRDGVSTAHHVAGELVITPRGRWQLRTDVYYKRQPSIMTFDYGVLLDRDTVLPFPVPPSTYVARARGEAFGAGIRAIRDGSIWWNGWREQGAGIPIRVEAGYDYGVSRRTYPSRFDGTYQPTPWNEPHRALISMELRPQAQWVIALRSRGTWGRSWGLRQSYYDLLSLGTLGVGLPIGNPADVRRPALLETDVGVTWTTRAGAWRAEIGAAVQNVLNRRNVLDYGLYRPVDVAAEAAYDRVPRYLPGAMPSVSIRVLPR